MCHMDTASMPSGSATSAGASIRQQTISIASNVGKEDQAIGCAGYVVKSTLLKNCTASKEIVRKSEKATGFVRINIVRMSTGAEAFTAFKMVAWKFSLEPGIAKTAVTSISKTTITASFAKTIVA